MCMCTYIACAVRAAAAQSTAHTRALARPHARSLAAALCSLSRVGGSPLSPPLPCRARSPPLAAASASAAAAAVAAASPRPSSQPATCGLGCRRLSAQAAPRRLRHCQREPPARRPRGPSLAGSERAALPLEAALQPAHELAAARRRSRRREAAEPAAEAARFCALSLAADSACCREPPEGWPAARLAARLPAAQRLSSPPSARHPRRPTASCRRAASTPRPLRLAAAAAATSRLLQLRQPHGAPPCRR